MKRLNELKQEMEENISPLDVLEFVISEEFLGKGVLQVVLSDCESNIAKRLKRFNTSASLSSAQSAALFLSSEYTERDALFIRRFFGGIP